MNKAEVMFKAKLWNEDVITEGGFSYFYPTDEMKAKTLHLKTGIEWH